MWWQVPNRTGAWRPTAWLTMQSELKRSRRWFSLQFAICRDVFINCSESDRSLVTLHNDFNVLQEVPLRSREQFWY